jgi:hypothetical protein
VTLSKVPRHCHPALWTASLGFAFSALVSRPATASDAHPRPYPTLPWIGTQLLPSPELAAGNGARFGLSWQLTPLSYSWGLNRRLAPWRFFVVEPLTRQSGSIEIFVAPAYLSYRDGARDRWFLRGGVRSYFPLVQRGENLSISVGSYYFRNYAGDEGAAYEVGAYVLYGFVGLRFAYAPAFAPARALTTLALRFF